MIKSVSAIFIIVFLCSCGVNTASSSKQTNSEIISDSDLVISDTIDPNPISSGDTSEPDEPEPDEPDVPINSSLSDFDTSNAIEDKNACNASTHPFVVSDASYGGELDGENGSAPAISYGQGLVVKSEYLSQDYESTWVYLYHKSFPTSDDLNLQGATSYTMDNVFQLSYDLAWADESISGIDNIVYIQSSKTEKPSCYRVTLNTITGSEVDVQKVYRVRL